MKRNIRYNLMGWMAAAMLLATSSCKDDTFANYGEELGDEVKVSFKLSPEAKVASTRAGEKDVQISDGSKADMLVYAIYDKEGNLLSQYGEGSSVTGFEAGEGQTVISATFPMEVSITLKRGEEYQIAFWAQSSKVKNAYKTEDLKKVEVNYSQVTDDDKSANDDSSNNTPNNDELRDAFCRSITLTAGENGSVQQNVHLFRPLAQINVGTSGFDYEIATRETEKKYTYSKIRINRAARYLDVVADKTYTSTTKDEETDNDGNTTVHKTPEAYAVVDYGWAPIPAYANMHDDKDAYDIQIPEYPSYTKWDWMYDENFKLNRDGKTIDKAAALGDDNKSGIYGKEYFLTVHRDFSDDTNVMPENDMDEDGFRDYATLSKHNDKESETFKYLSMCYILTASTEEAPVVINNIKVWLATDENGSDEFELLNLNQIPVQKNWRTNIIGNLMTEENTFEVKLDKDFAGEYSGWKVDDDNWKWTGPLADGLFYDGVNDVIEISSKEGLIWFQRLVNGDLTVRKAAAATYNDNVALKGKQETPAKAGEPYPYYRKNSKGEYETASIDYKTAKDFPEEVKHRIMVATHQINKNNGKGEWPKNNNFHFVGKDKNDYATVRLMADIDLTGEEWIPIGFEGRIREQQKEIFDDSDETNRGFYGVFDGNGHTISNISTKRFSLAVHGKSQQDGNSSEGPSDNPQWFGRGLFGQIGGSAKIRNVRLFNLDIYGCNGIGGVVGIAYGDDIEITNCYVDGGKIEAAPMLRGDSQKNTKNRTIARGVYVGGIVGYFYTQGGIVDNCEVRNMVVKGVRRVGGLIGSINQKDFGDGTDEGNSLRNPEKEPRITSISNNKISNTRVIVNSFNPYGQSVEYYSTKLSISKVGFGYNKSPFEPYSNRWLGGHVLDLKDRTDIKNLDNGKPKIENNIESGLTYSNISTKFYEIDANNRYRLATIEELPLKEMPMLSTWFCDTVILKSNYYGDPSANIRHNLHDYNFLSKYEQKYPLTDKNAKVLTGNEASQRNTFFIPMNLPFDVTVDYLSDTPKAGMYVGSVLMDGKGGIGGRSVVTGTNLYNDKECVMFVTSRDRSQFLEYGGFRQKPAKIYNMVLRGEPYANTGLLISPNTHLKYVSLYNVAIYDVFKTIALDEWENQNDFTIWPNTYNAASAGQYDKSMFFGDFTEMPGNNTEEGLNVYSCNLRGYTVPGKIGTVKYSLTTFERGASTGNGELEYTCKVETTTTFEGCFFKAPFIIDMTELRAGSTVTFINSQATSSSANSNIEIDNSMAAKSDKIVIENNQGQPVVKYYKNNTEIN